MKLRAQLTGIVLATGMVSPVFAAPPADTWFSSCEDPIATCDRPRPSSIIETIWTAGTARAEPPRQMDDERLRLPPLPESSSPYFYENQTEPVDGPRPIPERGVHEARAVLIQWQAATQSRLPATSADRLRLAHQHPGLSGLEQQITQVFQGPIDAEALWRRFDWDIENENGSLHLTAVPKDPLNRLVCERFEVRLDPEWRVATLEFAGHAARDRGLLVVNHVEHTVGKVVPASYETESPQPARLRTAEVENAVELTPTTTAPRLLRQTSELSLPLAPMSDVVE